MSSALAQLVELLQLEPLAENRFQGKNQDLGLPQVFGGQIVAQAISAAMNVVNEERQLHSCHAYFLQAGRVELPIEYAVDVLREGNSFTAVSVNAYQQHELLCRVTASFQVVEQGLEHQDEMPNVQQPDEFHSENLLIQQLAAHLPAAMQQKFAAERPFDVRIQYPNNPFKGLKLPAQQAVWARTNGKILAENHRLQQCLVAYFSDFHCLITALHPHEKGFMQQGMKLATLDHSLHFHRNADFSDWLLFALESPNAFGARGLTRGQVFDKQGNLIATMQQEGLIRHSLPQ